jgi:hypothetical protein
VKVGICPHLCMRSSGGGPLVPTATCLTGGAPSVSFSP